MEGVKTIIHDQDLPMHPWDEATRKTVYVHNRLSHIALRFKTSKDMCTVKKPEREENQVGSLWKEGNICWIW